MIDEELYKIATDELNSDNRNPAVWARACALASDDHDEARFLYTNLRVEEMLSKDGKQRTFSVEQAKKDESADKLDTLELTDLDDTSQKVSTPESSRSGVSSKVEPLPIDDIIEYNANQKDAPHTSVAGNAVHTDDAATFDAESLAELDALSQENAKNDGALSGLTGKLVSPDEGKAQQSEQLQNSVAGGGTDEDIYTTLLKQSAESAKNREQGTHTQHAPNLSEQLKPQADDGPAAAKDASAVKDAKNDEPVLDEPATAQLQHNLASNASAEPQITNTETAQQTDASIAADYAGTDILDVEAEDGDDLDVIEGRAYALFSRGGAIKAVKRGVSWPALLFTFPWLLSKAMLGTALVYAGLWVISIGGLLITSSTWLNAGDAAGLAIKLWTAAFALLAIIGLLYIPFRYGNRWVAQKLQNRGFDFKTTIGASNKRDAVDQLMESGSTLDL